MFIYIFTLISIDELSIVKWHECHNVDQTFVQVCHAKLFTNNDSASNTTTARSLWTDSVRSVASNANSRMLLTGVIWWSSSQASHLLMKMVCKSKMPLVGSHSCCEQCDLISWKNKVLWSRWWRVVKSPSGVWKDGSLTPQPEGSTTHKKSDKKRRVCADLLWQQRCLERVGKCYALKLPPITVKWKLAPLKQEHISQPVTLSQINLGICDDKEMAGWEPQGWEPVSKTASQQDLCWKMSWGCAWGLISLAKRLWHHLLWGQKVPLLMPPMPLCLDQLSCDKSLTFSSTCQLSAHTHVLWRSATCVGLESTWWWYKTALCWLWAVGWGVLGMMERFQLWDNFIKVQMFVFPFARMTRNGHFWILVRWEHLCAQFKTFVSETRNWETHLSVVNERNETVANWWQLPFFSFTTDCGDPIVSPKPWVKWPHHRSLGQ